MAHAGADIPVDIRGELKNQGVQFDLGRIISASINVATVLGIIALLLYFVRGAYLWMGAGGDKAQVEQARSVFTNGLIGMTILASVLAIYAIVDQFFGVGLTGEGGGISCEPPSCLCTFCSCSSIGGTYCDGVCTVGGCLTQ